MNATVQGLSEVQLRNFRVFEYLLAKGPLGLDDIAGQTDIPRTTVYRCIQNYVGIGWVRPMLDGSRFVVTSQFRQFAAEGSFAMDGVNDIGLLVRDLSKSEKVHIDVGAIAGLGDVRIFESTDRKLVLGKKLSFAFDDLPIALMEKLPAAEAERHIKKYNRDAPLLEQADAAQQLIKTRMEILLEKGFLFEGASFTACVAVKMEGEQPLGFRVRPYASISSSVEHMRKVSMLLVRKLCFHQ